MRLMLETFGTFIHGTVVLVRLGGDFNMDSGDGCGCYLNTEDCCRVDAWDKCYVTSEKDCGVDSGDGCLLDIGDSCDDDLCYANPKNNSSILDAGLNCD